MCAPSPSKVLTAKPSHSSAGSKVSVATGSPAQMVALRRNVLSAVLIRPVPHSVVGLFAICPSESMGVAPLRSTTVSLPLYQLRLVFVWSATAMIAGSAVAWAST